MISRAIFFADLQIPYHDPRTVAVLEQYLKYLSNNGKKVDLLVMGGDLVDFTGLTIKFLRRHQDRRPLVDELLEARKQLDRLSALTPKAQHVFTGGNHEARLRTYMQAQAPELEFLMDDKRFGDMSFDALFDLKRSGYDPYIEYPDPFEYKGFVFKHGVFHSKDAGARELKLEGSSGMSGHLHQYRVHTETNRKGSHAWFHSPCMCHTRGPHMPPGRHSGIQDWTQGFMEILFNEEDDEQRLFQVNPIIITGGRAIAPDGRVLKA